MHRRLAPLLLIVALTLLGAASCAVAHSAQRGERCFAETGFCISGPIRVYWERNGGLAVFGFPITAQSQESVEGRALQVQWFERDRLEIQPDGRVTAGRLGAERLEQLGTPWQPGPGSAAGPGCAVFPETGHQVCGAFLRYWRANGGLERFGLPLTGEFTAELEGRPFTVQYFERRRFELHPEIGPDAVLLGLLGREVLQTRGAASGLTRPEGLPAGQVVNVVDGDTVDVRINGQVERVRLIGIDTPESVDPRQPVECFGREASARAAELLAGQTVFLEADATQADRDQFGRLLRYLWLPDGRMANYELIDQGYAFEYTFAVPYRYQAQFKAAEARARAEGRGLWSPATCNGQRSPEATPAPTSPPIGGGPSFRSCADDPGPGVAPETPVRIIAIDKRAETVTLRNVSNAAVDLTGWRMCSIRGGQEHPIGGVLAPGETRVFPGPAENIWNNNERDPGALYDAQGRLISYWRD
ncbi:MAG: thermonuclease family protein [Oscillochloridaceae bacterium]|nr:thermonuclease family protein [Chloroflexaceae bacterium]MDW8390775.1 thermonuclease family protein [Oscillochloridaceae bacterium]